MARGRCVQWNLGAKKRPFVPQSTNGRHFSRLGEWSPSPQNRSSLCFSKQSLRKNFIFLPVNNKLVLSQPARLSSGFRESLAPVLASVSGASAPPSHRQPLVWGGPRISPQTLGESQLAELLSTRTLNLAMRCREIHF